MVRSAWISGVRGEEHLTIVQQVKEGEGGEEGGRVNERHCSTDCRLN